MERKHKDDDVQKCLDDCDSEIEDTIGVASAFDPEIPKSPDRHAHENLTNPASNEPAKIKSDHHERDTAKFRGNEETLVQKDNREMDAKAGGIVEASRII